MTIGAEKRAYKAQMQKVGFKLANPQIPVQGTVPPVTVPKPGLGAKTISHPYRAGKQHI